MTRLRQFGIGVCGLATLLGIGVTPALAAPLTFDFTFRYTDTGDSFSSGAGTVVTGSFQGDRFPGLDAISLLDDYVSNITNLAVSYSADTSATHGAGSFTGPLFIINYFTSPSIGFVPGPGKVYFDKGSNNFLMLNCDYSASNPCGSNEGFMIRNGAGGGDEDSTLYIPGNPPGSLVVIAKDRNYQNSPWTLTERTTALAAVPEPASLLLLGSGLAAAAMLARRRSRRGQRLEINGQR